MQYDQLTGQYYLKARYYNPVIGRFTQMDTYLGDGLNLYTYVQNNPVRYVDPSGHCAKCSKENGGSESGTSTGKLTILDGDYSTSEINAAQYVADLGNEVVLRPPVGTRAGGQTSDLLVNGVNYDVYTPTTNNPFAIIRAITKKNTQTTGVVLDLSHTTVTADDLGNILPRVKGAIETNGGVCNINDIIIMPK